MRVFGFLRGAGRPTLLTVAVVCLACVSEAAVPEASARQTANTGEYRAVVDRLVRLERELNDLQRATYSRMAARRTERGSRTDGSYAPPPSESQQRINDLEAALRSLTGRMEQLEYQMRQLDARVQRLTAAADRGSPAGLTPPQASGMTGRPDSGTQPEIASGPGAPENLATKFPMGQPRPGGDRDMPVPDDGAPSPQPDGAASGAAGSSGGPGEPGAGGSEGASSAIKLSGDEGKDFNRARDLLLRGEFARAGDIFGAIAKAYPNSKLAGDSQFWKAESLFVRELYRDAAEAYLVVARDFPDSAKAPDSLVKLSLSFDKLGERKQACAALAQLSRRYPKAPEKVRQNADRIKEEFSCR